MGADEDDRPGDGITLLEIRPRETLEVSELLHDRSAARLRHRRADDGHTDGDDPGAGRG